MQDFQGLLDEIEPEAELETEVVPTKSTKRFPKLIWLLIILPLGYIYSLNSAVLHTNIMDIITE